MRVVRFRPLARFLPLLCLLAGPAAAVQAAVVVDDVPITVQTTECSGDTGMASFEVSRLYRIQAGNCPDPADPERTLQQVLIRSDGDLTRYQVLLVSQDEAAAILQQVRAVSQARLDNLTRADIVVQHVEARPPTAPAEPSATVPPESSAPPRIELIDPPVALNRSVNRIILAPDAQARTVVGRVAADAGMLSLTVNGVDHGTDDSGLFKARIATADSVTPVAIVAVDKQGGRSSIEFELVRQRPRSVDSGSDDDAFGRYHALIIANNAYQHMDDLATPANDGLAVARLLEERFGFRTITLFDATRYEILSQLNTLRGELTENDNLLIYFAGHGAYDAANRRGHWLPVDAERDSTANWVSTVDVTDVVNAMSARHVLVVADSCYSGALSRSVGTDLDPGMSEDLRARWLRTMARNRSRHVLTSGGLKPVPDDAGNGHSIFANAFLETLQTSNGIVEGSVLFREVKGRVLARAEALDVEQTPSYAELKQSAHEYGEFLLVTR